MSGGRWVMQQETMVHAARKVSAIDGGWRAAGGERKRGPLPMLLLRAGSVELAEYENDAQCQLRVVRPLVSIGRTRPCGWRSARGGRRPRNLAASRDSLYQRHPRLFCPLVLWSCGRFSAECRPALPTPRNLAPQRRSRHAAAIEHMLLPPGWPTHRL